MGNDTTSEVLRTSEVKPECCLCGNVVGAIRSGPNLKRLKNPGT